MKNGILFFLIFLLASSPSVLAVEQIETRTVLGEKFIETEVQVRQTATEKSYVSIVAAGQARPRYAFQSEDKNYSAPDYRMLDAKTKPKDVGYDGPVSDRKKVYLFAGALAASGVAAAVAAPAAAGGAAASGAGVFYAGGAAVSVGTIGTYLKKSRLEPGEETFIHQSKARLLPL